MADVFVVKVTATNLVTALVSNQSEANRIAAEDAATLTAVSGAVTVGPFVRPGAVWHDATDGIVFTPPDNASKLQAAASHALGSWKSLSQELREEALGQSAAAEALVRDTMFRALQGLYAVLQRTTVTTARKIGFSTAYAQYPTDGEKAFPFYAAIRTVGTPPTFPIVWVNPTTGARTTMAVGIALSGSGRGNLNLLATESPDSVNIAAGAWINSLAA